MIKLKLGDIRNPGFQEALNQLCFLPFPVRVGHNIGRIRRQSTKELQNCQDTYVKLLKKNCVLDEAGNLAPRRKPDRKDPDGNVIPGDVIPNTFTVRPEAIEEYNKDMEEFDQIAIELQSYPVKISDLEGQKLSGHSLSALEPILEDDPTKTDCIPAAKEDGAKFPPPKAVPT